jgi:dihydropteroate synthase
LERLSTADYLKVNGVTREQMLDEAMIEFENKWKRTVDFGEGRDPKHQVPGWKVGIPGLKESRRKRFIENHMLIEQ